MRALVERLEEALTGGGDRPWPQRDLAAQHCVPCRGGVPPLAGAELEALLARLGPNGWVAVARPPPREELPASPTSRRRSPSSTGSARSPRSEGHHPDLHLSWGKVRVEIWTHKIDGLTESDFVLAAKIDRLT